MRKATILYILLPLIGYAQQFSFTARGHTYQATVTSETSSGLGFAGHWLYEPSVLLPSSLTSSEYVMLFNSNTTANTSAWPTGEAIYMQTSSDGLSWGTPTAILAKPSNVCDMINARPVYDDGASLWRVYVGGVPYDSNGSCEVGSEPVDNELYEATGSSLTSLSWYGSGGNATSLSGNIGSPGLGEPFQYFNVANYDGPSGYPFMYIYNDWNFTDSSEPPYTYCPTCAGLDPGTDVFSYLSTDGETGNYFWYYTSVATALSDYGSGNGYLLLYPDVLLGGTADQSTLGAPGFGFGNDCTTSSFQYGRGIGFYATPVPNNATSPSLAGQFQDGDWSSSTSGLIISARVARNQYGFLDKASSSPNTWQTYVYYNVADEHSGNICPYPTIQNTFRNSGSFGNPSAAWGVSLITITEQ